MKRLFLCLLLLVIFAIPAMAIDDVGSGVVSIIGEGVSINAAMKQAVYCSDWKEDCTGDNGVPTLVAFNSSSQQVLVIPLTSVAAFNFDNSCPGTILNLDNYTP